MHHAQDTDGPATDAQAAPSDESVCGETPDPAPAPTAGGPAGTRAAPAPTGVAGAGMATAGMATADEPAAPSLEEALAQGANTTARQLRVGSMVRGTVSAVAADQLLVDVGGKTDGVVPAAEAVVPTGKPLTEVFTPGQVITVTVLGFDPAEGAPRLSQRRAETHLAWQRLDAAFRSGEPVEAPVTAAVRGGLVLDVGVRGFMPASHVQRGPAPDLAAFVGQTLRAKVIELDRARGQVILSRKAVLEEDRRRERERRWSTLHEGEVCEGVVKSLSDFGAFVDLGGVDGLLHVSAMSWGRVERPSDVVAVGQRLTVKVLKVDREHGRVSLGLKQLQPDPWTQAPQRYAPGSVVEGRVTRLAPYGAFVQLEPGVDGLIHVSQMADHHVRDPGEVVQPGQAVRVRVLQVLPEERRIRLSLRDVESADGSSPTRAPTGGGGVTVGEVVGDLGGLLPPRPGESGSASRRGAGGAHAAGPGPAVT